MEMEIDRDGNVSVEMAGTLLWEHQGIEFPGDIPWFLQPQRPAAPPAKAKQVSLEVPPEEPFGPSSWESLRAVYQVLHEEMQEELDSRPAFLHRKIPTAPTWSAPPSPSKPFSSVSRLTS